MSGIYLHFNPAGLQSGDRARFLDRLERRITQLPGEPVEMVEGNGFLGASGHHGVLPTGGVAREGANIVLAVGSCWVDPEDTLLATPHQILSVFNSRSQASRLPFGGTFSLAHLDGKQGVLTVETDRFGSRPLYYRQTGNGLTVSSEIKFLIEPGHEKVDMVALGEIMALGYLPRVHTLVAGVERLPSHSRLTFSRGGLAVEALPTPGYPRNRPVDEGVIDEYDALVSRYLQRFSGLSDSCSISLSGGLDSRLLAAAADRDGFALDAFTIGEKGSKDAEMAQRVAKILDIPIRVHETDGRRFSSWFPKAVWFTEGRVLPRHMHYICPQLMRTVPPGPQIQGMAGETVLGGHMEDPVLFQATVGDIKAVCRKAVSGLDYWPDESRETTFYPDLIAKLKTVKPRVFEEIWGRIAQRGDYSAYMEFKIKLKGESFIIPCILGQVYPWSDAIAPFLDNDAHDFGATLEMEGIAERRGQIQWGLRHYPAIMDIPRIKAGVKIPVRDDDPHAYSRGAKRVAREKKLQYLICRISRGRINLPQRRSFPAYGQWYRKFGQVRKYVDDVLLSDQTLDRGIFRREGIEKLLQDCKVGRDTWGAISIILMTEVFLRQFVDGTDIPGDPITPWGLDP